jgi:translation initiation factor 1A
MPNKRGGKDYKRGKGGEPTQDFIDIQPGQYMARAIRVLGNRNVLCYCDDNVIRICHICRTMRKSEWVETGDMVLVSLRDFSAADPKSIKRGDVLAKYAPEQLRVLKKEGKVNERLFMKLEDRGVRIDAVGEDMTDETMLVDTKEDDLFEYDDEEASSSEEEEGPTIVSKKDKVNHRAGKVEKEIALDDL